MPTKNWYAVRALRFGILYVVALAAIKIFSILAALSGTITIFDNPLRIALLAGIGIGWPTFAPHHFDWLRSLTFARSLRGSLAGAAIIWAPFLIAALTENVLGRSINFANDLGLTWAIAGMLALSDREHPGDRKRSKREADETLRRVIASYEAIYGPAGGVPVPLRAQHPSTKRHLCR